MTQLSQEQQLIVDEELLDLFINIQEEIAADLGIMPLGGDMLWTDEQAERIREEIAKRHRQLIIDRLLA